MNSYCGSIRQVVEPGLRSALDVLLPKPVAKRTEAAGRQSARIGEQAGVEHGVDAEHRRRCRARADAGFEERSNGCRRRAVRTSPWIRPSTQPCSRSRGDRGSRSRRRCASSPTPMAEMTSGWVKRLKAKVRICALVGFVQGMLGSAGAPSDRERLGDDQEERPRRCTDCQQDRRDAPEGGNNQEHAEDEEDDEADLFGRREESDRRRRPG